MFFIIFKLRLEAHHLPPYCFFLLKFHVGTHIVSQTNSPAIKKRREVNRQPTGVVCCMCVWCIVWYQQTSSHHFIFLSISKLARSPLL